MMTKTRCALFAIVMNAALVGLGNAQTPHAAPSSVAERLKTLYPATNFGSVHRTPWPGVFEVAMGNQLAYVDATGQYFLFGHLYDMAAQHDITAGRKEALARIDATQLPLADALIDVRGTGRRWLAIFSDPDCPYCRKLEAELAALTDVTIHTFLMPLTSIHPEARAKAIGVWCAENRLATWQALMARNETPDTRTCAHPVDRNLALAERLGISGTPTLIARDGRVMAGAAGLAQIEAWLSRTKDAAK